MIEANTVFVIGAGASAEIGLPLGAGLRDAVQTRLSFAIRRGHATGGDQELFEVLRRTELSSATDSFASIKSAVQSVSSGMSGFPSVDRFLDFHREDEALVNILKMTIGKIIWEKEAASALSDSSRQSKAMELSQWWLARLLMLICDGVQKSDLECVFQHITFVIFNYDRCVEEFLFRAIQNTLALKADEAAALLSSLHVFHPYGSLGPLPWQPTAGNITSVPFGKPDPGKLALISGSLNTFTQGCQDRSVIDAIHSAIINARRLVFLGFGFLRMNLKFLSPELSLLRDLNRDVLGSAFEMPEDDRELASTFLQRRFSTSNVKLVNLRAKEVIEQHSWRLTL